MGVPLYFKTILEQYNNILISQNNDIKKELIYFLINLKMKNYIKKKIKKIII